MIDEKSPKELLIGALENNNTVSILLTGPSGSGKTHTIEAVLEAKHIKRQYIAAIFAPVTVEGWQSLMGELLRDQIRVLVIDHIEDMPMLAQSAMFHTFSNTYGDLSSFPDSSYRVRAIFTSVKTVAELRSNADIIMPHVYDRISQLIIRFYPLTSVENVWGRFKEVWSAMKFSDNNSLPKEGSLRTWISSNIDKMNGNYRDLEKLAIRWHNRRLLGFDEDRILAHINREYQEIGFGAEPEQDGAIFHIPQPNGTTVNWTTIEADFRRYLREWAVKEFGSSAEAAGRLGVSNRTLDRWK